MSNTNAINWFEIPVRDIARAQAFYEKMLDTALQRENMGDMVMAVFPHDRDSGVGGCLLAASAKPSAEGSLVYLNAGASIDAVLSRVAKAGGSVALPKTALPPGAGFFAHVTDSEGNKVGLHALA